MSPRSLKQRIKDREYVEIAQQSSTLVFIELVCIAAIAGAVLSSWLVFFGVVFILALIVHTPLAPVLFILFSLFWAGVTYLLSSCSGLKSKTARTAISAVRTTLFATDRRPALASRSAPPVHNLATTCSIRSWPTLV